MPEDEPLHLALDRPAVCGPLQQLEGRETMVPCKHRPGRKPCPGLMWVMKRSDDRIEVFCMVCRATEAVISGWQDTQREVRSADALPHARKAFPPG